MVIELWPGWTAVRELGRGSFGAVYEIERDIFGVKEKAACKHIRIPQSRSEVEELYASGYDEKSVRAHYEDFLADLVREYRLMASMKGHTNVVSCDDLRYEQAEDGIGWDLFIRMELLTPLLKSLGDAVREEQIVRLGRDMASALVLCRSRNIIHRDIKPQNIFVSKDGDYKLGDFGVAKTAERTSGGTKIGTYNYMAPEVYNNQPYGHPADIYSLGLVLYWLLNARRMPFVPLPPAAPKASEIEEARLRRFRGEPLPPPVEGSAGLKRIVLRACAFDPRERFQTAEELLAAFEALERRPRQSYAAPEADATLGVRRGAPQQGVRSAPQQNVRSTPQQQGARSAPQQNVRSTPQQQGARSAAAGKPAKKSTGGGKKKSPLGLILGLGGGLLALILLGAFVLGPLLSDGGPARSPSAPSASSVDLSEPITVSVPQPTIAAGIEHTLAVRTDGTAVATGSNYYGQCDVGSWTGLVGVAAGENHSVGLRSDGTVLATGENAHGQCDVAHWRNIVYVAAAYAHTLGVTADGRVLYAGDNSYEQCSVGSWSNIVAVFTYKTHTVGLRSDGTLVGTGRNTSGQLAFGGLDHILMAGTGIQHSVVLRADGAVFTVGDDGKGQCGVNGWEEMRAVAAGTYHTLCLRADGTVAAVGDNSYGQCGVNGWRSIVYVVAGPYHSLGLRADGTVVATGKNQRGESDVSGWTGIRVP